MDTLPDEFIKLLQPGTLGIGDVVAGRYKLTEKLGDGAMGQVFVAENLAIGRRVAIKVLRKEILEDPSFRRRFQQEADAIAAIEHRNVARFLDLVVGDPTFLVMEYVRGPTLDDVLEKERRLEPMRAVAIVRRLCWALEAAHKAGVIHRDIKPSNVILSEDIEAGEEPKLIDFGLAKLANASMNAGLTRTGQIVGTPEYMAPEQIAGGNIDARSDVYELGCLLFELLTGRPPFEGDDDVQVLYQQLHAQPMRLTRFVEGLPEGLQPIIDRALQKEQANRFQSMKEMAAALDALTPSPGPVHTAPVVPLPEPRKASWPIVVIAAAIALGAGWFLGQRGGGARGTALLLVSAPSGAQVEIDGQPIAETTPTTVRGLAPGLHAVRIRKGEKAVLERQVTLGENERAVLNVVLPPSSHPLEVHSTPEGASVYVDGKLVVGETPTVVEVTDDDFHEVRVEKTGFETGTKALTPDDHSPSITIPLSPERQPRGSVMVDSNTACSVFIDGVDTGYTTPTLAIYVATGTHTIEVRDGAGGRASAKVKIEQGQTQRLLLSPRGAP